MAQSETELELVKVQQAMGQSIAIGLPTPEECLLIYKLLGPSRSYPQVEKYFKDVLKRRAPTHETLKKWGAKGKWQYYADQYDREIASKAEARLKEEQSKEVAADIEKLSSNYRRVSSKLLKKIESKIDGLKLGDGTQLKAATEAAVNLAKAAEVMDGGVSDRTENREVMTIEERKSAAEKLVDNAFAAFRSGGGNDNAKRTNVDNGGDARGGAAAVQGDPRVGGGAA